MRLHTCEKTKSKMRRREEASLMQIPHLKFDYPHRKQSRADENSGRKKKMRVEVLDDDASSGLIAYDLSLIHI